MTSPRWKLKLVIIVVVAIAITAVALANAQCTRPPDTTMVAWYPFDDLASTSADIASGNTGTQFGTLLPLFIPGWVTGAAHFNGTDRYVESASSIANNFGPKDTPFACRNGGSACYGNFSIDTWIRIFPGAPSGYMAIVDKRGGAPPSMHGYHFFVEGGSIGLQLADGLGSGTGYTNYYSPVLAPNIYDGNWHHIAVTVDRKSSTGIVWYHNGVPIGTSDPLAAPTRFGSLVNNSPLRIGTRTADPPKSGWLQADLDELEIFNRDLKAKEVSDIYNAGSYGKFKPSNAWTINFGYAVSDAFSTPITKLDFVYWVASTTDLLTTVDMQIGSTSFGGTPQTLTGFTNTLLGSTCDGFELYLAHLPLPSFPWSGPGYVTLSNACTVISGCSTNPNIYVYWDQSFGSSTGYSNVGNGDPLSCAEPGPGPFCPFPNPIPPENFVLN